jgi:hypothetical protein
MLVNLAIKMRRQLLVIVEASKQSHPVVKVKSVIFNAYILVELLDNFNEVSHNIREKGYACQHDQYANYLLHV